MATASPPTTPSTRIGYRRLTASLWTPGVRNVVAPVIFFAIVVGLWQASVFNNLLDLEEFAVPLPADIATAVSENRDELWRRFRETFSAVILGYGVGNALGFVLALTLIGLPGAIARRLDATFGAVQALPIIALAPIVSLWVESILWFKAVTVVILVFPPMLVYAYRGMTSVDQSALELARSYDASPLQVLRLLRVPTAVPQLFTALRYTTVLALIGVVICEILKSGDGLGFEIHDSLQTFSTSAAWAAVAILALTGILAYALLMVVERLLFPWSVKRGSQ